MFVASISWISAIKLGIPDLFFMANSAQFGVFIFWCFCVGLFMISSWIHVRFVDYCFNCGWIASMDLNLWKISQMWIVSVNNTPNLGNFVEKLLVLQACWLSHWCCDFKMHHDSWYWTWICGFWWITIWIIENCGEFISMRVLGVNNWRFCDSMSLVVSDLKEYWHFASCFGTIWHLNYGLAWWTNLIGLCLNFGSLIRFWGNVVAIAL